MKVGDTVKCIKEYDENRSIIGKVGKIVAKDGRNYGVYFEEKITSGHDLNGNFPDGHGWWFYDKSESLLPYKKKIVVPKVIKIGDYQVHRVSKKGFFVGCVFVSWETHKKIGKLKPKK